MQGVREENRRSDESVTCSHSHVHNYEVSPLRSAFILICLSVIANSTLVIGVGY